MTKREVVKLVLDHKPPPYVPWHFGFTVEAREKLVGHYGENDLEEALGNHFLSVGGSIRFFEEVGPDLVRDVFGVIWDRSIDKDIGNVKEHVLTTTSLEGYTFPDPMDPHFFENIPDRIERHGDRFRIYEIGFSLYERAWTLRGMENLMMDFYDHPSFVRELFNSITEYNITQIRKALEYDIDAVHLGDDWGQQHGLQMGPVIWKEFIYPALKRMYRVVKDAGKYVMIHSCGDVDELFDDLIDIGLNCFNPFQPEVMDVYSLLRRYRGKLAFNGGLSTQRTLPYGSPDDVRRESERLLKAGRKGGYIFAPAHAVEGDVPLENILAFIESARSQAGT